MNNFILIFAISGSLLTAEESSLLVVQGAVPEYNVLITDPDTGTLLQSQPASIEYKKLCPHGAISLSSGTGISLRSRNGLKGRALDLKVGVGSISIFSAARSNLRSVSLDYNWFTFFRPNESSPYFSWGLGGAVVFGDDWKALPIPLAPFRIGYQSKHWFVDAGAKMFFWLPLPELRAGMSFDF